MNFFIIGIVLIVFCVIAVILIILSIYKNNSSSSINRPISAICNPNELMQAYIQDIPSNPECPSFENKYVVSHGESGVIQLFEKNLRADLNCCWFSNEVQQRTRIELPFILNANIPPAPDLTLEQLNQKPYLFRNGFITDINPSCQESCISIQRVQDNRYSIIKSPVPAPGVQVLLSNQGELERVTFNGASVVTRQNGRYVIIPDVEVPAVVQLIVEIYNSSRLFLPIPRMS